MSPARRPAAVALVLLLALLLVPSVASAAGAVGEQAPDYAAITVEGDPVELADLRGEAVVLNVWATWCVPCREELPELQALQERFAGEDVRVVGVSVDSRGAGTEVAAFLDARDIRFDAWLDPDEDVQRAFRTSGVPETIVIDRDGVVVHRVKGPLESDRPLDDEVERALAATGDYADRSDTRGSESDDEISVVALLVAFGAGLLSFLSPCVLPLLPAFLAVLGGTSAGAGSRNASLRMAVPFVVGFSLVFIALGASASAIGGLLRDWSGTITLVGGIALVVLGLSMLGVLRIPALQRELRVQPSAVGRRGPAGAFAIGVTFGAGWTPCIGPVLAGILTLAAASASTAAGIGLLAAYSLGLAIPFLVAAALVDRLDPWLRRSRRALPWVSRVSGALLVVVGILLATGSWTRLNAWLVELAPGLANLG